VTLNQCQDFPKAMLLTKPLHNSFKRTALVGKKQQIMNFEFAGFSEM
jgi:hypothetical protein